MLRFAVHDEKGPAAEWPLVGAHLLGPDDVAVPGQIKFDSRHIVCRRRASRPRRSACSSTPGISARSCCRPACYPIERAPYLLSIELARHRIKTFLVKSEEWQIFDLDPEHPAIRAWEEARQDLHAGRSAAGARPTRIAMRKALSLGIKATESLALCHAEILLHRRFGQRAGVLDDAGRANLARSRRPIAQGARADGTSTSFMIPLRWRRLEVEEGIYDWKAIDSLGRVGREVGKPVVARPAAGLLEASLPKWMYVWQHDYDTCRDLAYDHVEHSRRALPLRRRHVERGLGSNTNENFQFTLEQMVDLVRMASLAGAAVDPWGADDGRGRAALRRGRAPSSAVRWRRWRSSIGSSRREFDWTRWGCSS